MFLLELLTLNVVLILIVSLYCKLTCGICKCSRHLCGKVVIVTGGNAGIGFETAKNLAERGARVILACRNEIRGIKARDHIRTLSGNDNVHFKQLDLASFASIKRFAEDILKTEDRLDILINNAGVYISENKKTEDGSLEGMQINYFGPYLLTNLLLPILKSTAPSRIINVTSMVYKYGKLDFDNLNMEKEGSFNTNRLYMNSKLCQVLWTVELDRRLRGSKVTVNCLHPGAVGTNIMKIEDKFWAQIFKPIAGFVFMKNVWEGAQTSIYLAVAPEVAELSGRYFRDCLESSLVKKARDPELASKLWDVTEKIIGVKQF